jgi:hypothetical protein
MFRERLYEKLGMILWLVGCVAFIGSAWNADDPWALTGAILFLIGVALFTIPLFRRKD